MQQIIVYRNPLEAAFWNSVSGGQLFPILVGVVVFFAVFLTLNKLVEVVLHIPSWGRKAAVATNIELALAAAVACGVAYALWV